MYEEKMHTPYRFNTLLITRGHVISKRNTIRCVINIVVMRVHWFELLMLQFSDRVSEKEVQGWLFRWNDPDRYYSEFCLEISTFFYWYWTIHFKMWKKLINLQNIIPEMVDLTTNLPAKDFTCIKKLNKINSI